MKRPLAFVLNFDAELELERGERYQPTTTTTTRMLALAAHVRPFLPARATVLYPLAERASPDALTLAWCPTPRALRILQTARLEDPIDVPDVSVLARVNDRRFAIALDVEPLAGGMLIRDLEAARDALARPGEWLLKRCFGVSGRGQRRVRGGWASELDLAFVSASLRRHGALVIEPRVVIERELSVHAWQVGPTTHVRSIREPFVDAHGAFVRSMHADGIPSTLRDALESTARRVGAALHAAGYRGPFGVDAFIHRGAGDAAASLRALSEINARYCMGWDDVDGWLPPS